jgi:hypothetical protein
VGRVHGQAVLDSQGSNSIVPWRNPLTPKVDRRIYASVSLGATAHSALRFEHDDFSARALQDPRGRQAGIARSNHDDGCLVHFAPNTSVVQQALHTDGE